jgi:hypothetical protein
MSPKWIRAHAGVLFCASLLATRQASAQPDVITGHVGYCLQLGREGPIGSGIVGLGMDTTACNQGTAAANWIALAFTDHPVINLNMYRLTTANGADRFEQIGQSWLKHGFGSANADECGFGCAGGRFEEVGPGCSDTYAAGQFEPCGFGTPGLMAPRSVIHPYRGTMPSSGDLGPGGGCDFNFASANHIGHVHDGVPYIGISHRLQVDDVDLIPALNPGARYFGEGQYLVPDEYASSNGSQNNNVTHQELFVAGPDLDGVFTFTNSGVVHVSEPAVNAWPGSSQTRIEPSPMNDGRAILAAKVTDLGGGVSHYEYAIYNMNMDTSIRSFRVPLPPSVSITNVGFHAPRHHAPELNADNYSNAPWTVSVSAAAIEWSTDTVSVDPLANALRYGTMYNFRFDADAAPGPVLAEVGLFKIVRTMQAATIGPGGGPRNCNSNAIEDACDVDCNAPGCNVAGCGTSSDCTGNGIPDDCESDCNGDLTPDGCEVLAGASDCNLNGRPDTCDVSDGSSQELNGDGVPDECLICPPSPPHVELIANVQGTPVASVKNRYLSFRAGDGIQSQAIQVTLTNLPPPYHIRNGLTLWVTEPELACETSGVGRGQPCPAGHQTFLLSTLTCDGPVYTQWSSRGTIHVHHESIVPGGIYDVGVIDPGCLNSWPISTTEIATGRWGNVAGPFSTALQLWTAPESPSSVDVTVDVVAVLGKFRNQTNSPVKARADVEPLRVDQKISISDVTRILDAFRGRPYPYLPGSPPC